MFKHIGRKVKGVAIALFVLGVLGSIGAAVFLYLSRLAELALCIVIAAGGSLAAWLNAWVLYCIGDTNVRVARLEDKLIPKPAYEAYLAGNNPIRGACEICGRTTDLIDAKIEDRMGTRYRKVCRECFAANNCKEKD